MLLDPDQLVVLGEPVGARQRAGLDLPAIGGDGEVGDRRILGFAGAVRHDGAIAGAHRHFDGLQRLRQGADLVDLDQHRVGGALVDAAFDPARISHEQIVADQLDAAAQLAGH